MNFEDTYRKYVSEITSIARRQYVPDMDADDVASEMTIALWKATQTYTDDFGAPFGAYWWGCWMNRKKDLLEAAGALKRPKTIAMSDTPHQLHGDVLIPEVPARSGSSGAVVWKMLACGQERKDVLTFTELSKRSYYVLLNQWRTDEVRESLRD